MVSALDSGVSGLGSSLGRGHCIVFLGKTLYSHGASLSSQVYKRAPANFMLGGNNLASHADVLRFVTRSSPRTSAQRTGHICSLAISQSWRLCRAKLDFDRL